MVTDEERTSHGTDPGRALEEEIRGLSAEGRISCHAAFSLAERRGVSVSDVGRIIDGMGIKIVACQLGCFK